MWCNKNNYHFLLYNIRHQNFDESNDIVSFYVGLFQRVIVHSGSPLAFWAMTDPQFPQGTNLKPSCSEFEDCRNKTYKEYLKSLNKTQLATIKGLVSIFNWEKKPACFDMFFLGFWYRLRIFANTLYEFYFSNFINHIWIGYCRIFKMIFITF